MRTRSEDEIIDAYKIACAELEAATNEYYQSVNRYQAASKDASNAHQDMAALLKRTSAIPDLPELLPEAAPDSAD